MLHKAAKLAAEDSNPRKNFLLGAIALRRDGATVFSCNSTVPEHPTPSAHAEVRVLRKSGSKAILWVARVLKDRKTWAMARPCKLCRASLINKEAIRVYYTIGPNEYGVWEPSGISDVIKLKDNYEQI